MFFEWDENKRRLNIKEHGVDFKDAALIFGEPFIIESPDTRQNYKEERIRALGCMNDICYMVVYTWRNDKRRIISAWKVNENGKRRYKDIISGKFEKN